MHTYKSDQFVFSFTRRVILLLAQLKFKEFDDEILLKYIEFKKIEEKNEFEDYGTHNHRFN